MKTEQCFFNLGDLTQGLPRELGPGVNTRIFVGDRAMLSIVTLEPNAQSSTHSHAEEQWGLMVEGEAVRTQGGVEISVRVGDFWRTPSNIPHSLRAGPKGARVLDIFSPPREEYRKAGAGLGLARPVA